MIVIPPLATNTSNTVSNVPEPSPGEVEWNVSTNYAQGAVIIRTSTHRKYECVLVDEDHTVPELNTKKWLDIGPTNKWAMFDNLRSEQTKKLGSMEFSITPGKRVDSLALLGLQATKVTVWMTVGANTVWGPIERNTSGRNTTTWSQYFFGEFKYIPSLLFQDLPPYASAVIHVKIENAPTLDVGCSEVVIGTKVYLGAAQYNAVSDSQNFSRIDRDDFATAILRQRRTIPKLNVETWADKNLVNQIREVRTDLNAVPALWSALDDNYNDPYFEATFIYGIYKQFEINISGPSLAIVNLELEEM